MTEVPPHAHGGFFFLFRLASKKLLTNLILTRSHIKKKNSTLVFFVFLQIFIFHNVTITVPENFTQCTTHGSFVKHWQETVYNMFTFVCLFLLPLVIMIFCYTRILVEISSRMARNNCTSACFWLRSNLRALLLTLATAARRNGMSGYERRCEQQKQHGKGNKSSQ